MTLNTSDGYEALMQFLYQAPIGLVQINAAGDIEMLNPMSARLLMPLSCDGSLDNLYVVLQYIAPQLRTLGAAVGAEGGTVCESLRVVLPAHGSSLPQILAISILKIEADRLIGVLIDSTQEVQREQQGLALHLAAESRIDSLTRLPNRAAVRERLQLVIDRAASDPSTGYALLYLNCDRFGRVNDAHGPAVGDHLLVQMAERLRNVLPQPDRGSGNDTGRSLAARLGSDEFVLLIEDTVERIDADATAQRVIEALGQNYDFDGRRLHCNVSIGLLRAADSIRHADAALQAANLAMVEAKRAGGAQTVIFEPDMQRRAERHGVIEADLRHAIGDEQLFVVYQPVIALQGGARHPESAGVEALVRWRHPTLGIVPPLEFIGIAEASGLIASIGHFVLETACRQFVQWQAELGEHAPRTMAVNLSRAQLLEAGFVAAVDATLKRNQMDAACLQLEVTESLAAQDDVVQGRLHELKALGLTLALDDFGTGYSSLASLHLLPVDTVKIDRSFVARAASSHPHRVLISATVTVANSLGMNTVAEGVEDAKQARIVAEYGCDKGQGYFYSRPLPADEVAAWLREKAATAS